MSKKILVIEGDDVTREVMRKALESRGYDVMVAADGVGGYETAVFMKPDLIVTGIQIPGTNGIDLVRQVRDTAALKATPILVATAFGTGSATFSLQEGANGYEPKPINLQSFLTTVKRLLASRDRLRAA